MFAKSPLLALLKVVVIRLVLGNTVAVVLKVMICKLMVLLVLPMTLVRTRHLLVVSMLFVPTLVQERLLVHARKVLRVMAGNVMR
jgi:hypothetical protein